jgi:hypothetical protein
MSTDTTPRSDSSAGGNPAATPAHVAQALLTALSGQDWPGVRNLLADNVWMRALLTREVTEAHDADSVVAALRTWHGDTNGFVVLEATRDTIEHRESIRWRFAERPGWAPDQWHVIEQTGYLRVRDGRISRLDLVCTGYHPVDAPPTTNAAASARLDGQFASGQGRAASGREVGSSTGGYR